MRLVLDATVLVRTHQRSRSTGRKVLNAVLEGRHELLLSNEIIVETTRVLRYPRLQKLYALTEDELYDYAQFLQRVCQTVVLDHPYHAPRCKPPSAEMPMCSVATDFHDARIMAFCAARGIDVRHGAALLARLVA